MKFTKMVPCYKNENGEILLGEPIDISLEIPEDLEAYVEDSFTSFGFKLITDEKEI